MKNFFIEWFCEQSEAFDKTKYDFMNVGANTNDGFPSNNF